MISGSAGNQISMDGEQSGAFTGMLKKVWNRGKFRGEDRALRDKILSSCRRPDAKLNFNGARRAFFTTGYPSREDARSIPEIPRG